MGQSNGTPFYDLGLYATNRARFPPEELNQYRGEHVAFSLDGTQVVAHGRDWDTVIADLKACGILPSEVGWSFVPAEDCIL